MKKIILFFVLFFTISNAFCQSFMHGAGIIILVRSSEGEDASIGEGFTYFPRFNFLETEALSVSAGIPLTLGITISSSAYSLYGTSDQTSVGFVFNAPLIINLNMGRGSTKDNTQKFGYFVGAGFGYYHGEFVVSDIFNGDYTTSENSVGPAANAGMRFGVGRKHKNIEVRFSYMKGITDFKPNLFGVACSFNF